jgi:hypothetical protein
MADQVFMYLTTAGTMIAFGALLFVSRGIRARSASKLTSSSSPASSSSSSSSSSSRDADRKVKKYSSDGKPIYED